MSTARLKVLVVDDEPPIRKLLRMGLRTQGYSVLEAPNGKTALEFLNQGPDLIVLDLGLPDIQGHNLLRMIRARNERVPIVVLSSRGDEAGKVQALDFGADDYVTKPFGMDELLARMRAALRHQLQVHGERPIFCIGDLSVDLVRRVVRVGNKDVKLSPKEYELLRVLVQHAGKVLTHKFLLGELWDELTGTVSASLCAATSPENRTRSRAASIHSHRDRDRLSAARPRLKNLHNSISVEHPPALSPSHRLGSRYEDFGLPFLGRRNGRHSCLRQASALARIGSEGRLAPQYIRRPYRL